MLCVVRLDEPTMPAGPGLVLELTDDPIRELLIRYRDRDGGMDERLRFWLHAPGVTVGDRVQLRQCRVERAKAEAYCDCGQSRPCKFHDVTAEMTQVFVLLRAMNPEQRSRIFCWFCSACGKERKPGEGACSCSKEDS